MDIQWDDDKPSFEKAKRDYPRLTQEAEEIRRRELLPDGGGMTPTSRIIPGVTEKYYESLGQPMPSNIDNASIEWEEPKKNEKKGFSLSKELSGLGAGVADAVAGALSMPIAGLVGLGATPFLGAEKGAELVGKTQDMLTPSSAATKLGVPKEYTTDTGTHDILMHIMSAPHEYLSKPIADLYFNKTGNPLASAVLQGTLDLPAYFLAFKGAKAVAGAGARPRSPEVLRKELGYGKEPVREVDTTKYNQTELPFGEERLPVKAPYDVLPPELRAQLEAELNPPVEQRRSGQGELFTEERPRTPEEAATHELNTKFPLSEPGPTIRTRPDNLGGDPRLMELEKRSVASRLVERQLPEELERREFSREQTQGELPFSSQEAGLPFEQQRMADRVRQQVEEQNRTTAEREAAAQRQAAESAQGQPFSPELPFRGPGNRQRGSIGYLPERTPPIPVERQRQILDREKIALTNSLKRNEDMMRDLDSGQLSQAMRDYLAREKISPMQLRQETKQYIDSLKKDIAQNGEMLKTILEKQERPKASVTSIDAFKGPGSRQRGFISFNREVKNKGLAPALVEYQKQFNIDKRPIAEIAKEMQEKKTPDIGEMAKGGGYISIPSQLGLLTKNPLVKAVTDKLGALRRDTANKIRDALTGVKYETNIFGREKRVWGEEGGLTKFRRYYHESKARRAELSEMKDTWIQNVGKAPLSRESFRTERQWETYSSMRKVLDKARNDVNKALESAGRKPIEWVENYFPAIWEGDYRVWVKDGSGELRHVVGTTSMKEANKLKAEFQKAAPDMMVEVGPYKKGKYDMSDLSSFEEAARVLAKEGNTKMSAEFNRIYSNVMAHRGFGKHGLQRKGIEGFLGSEKGVGGLRNMEHAYETYVTRAYRFISNIEKAKLHAELDALPKETQKAQMRAIEISKAYIDQARGKTVEEPITNAANWLVGQIGEKIPVSGLGQGSLRRGLHNVSALVLPYWLMTGKYFLSNMVQPTVNLAQLSRLKSTGETAAMPAEALIAGYKNAIMPDKVAIDGANWAARKGYFDPTIAGLLEAHLSRLPSNTTKAVMDLMRKPTGWVEQHMVRLPSFLMYEYALRDSIKDSTKRFEKAAEIMNDRMVDYDLTNSPIAYGKIGLAGEAIRPLKQYPHNIWGQFLDYAAYTKDTKSIAPMAYFLGQQISMAGLKGMAFVPEVTAMVALYNYVFNQDVPTPEHALMTSGMPDWLVMGGLSTALGYDVSKSVAHPSLPIMLQSPPIMAAGVALKDVFDYVVHKIKGTATDADTMKAWLAITPNVAHGYIEELYTPEGGMTPNPNDDMRGVYKRKETEKLNAKLWSMRSVDEAKQRALNYGAMQLLKQDAAQKTEALSAIIDRIQNKEPVDKDLIEKYIQEGGSPERLQSDIQKRIAERQLTPWERAAKGTEMTNNKWNKLKRMKEMMDADIERRKGETSSNKEPAKSEPEIQWDDSKSNINPISTEAQYARANPHPKTDQIKHLRNHIPKQFIPHDMPIGKAGSPGTVDEIPDAFLTQPYRNRPKRT